MKRFKESSHARARRLNLHKPHIMWCKHLKCWVLAAYTFENEISGDDLNGAIEFLDRYKYTPLGVPLESV